MNFKLPDKLTFKRKEVINITKLDGRVLDYWEREFGGLSPVINKVGEKFYTKKDIELILKIKQLLIVEKKDKSQVKEIIGMCSGDSIIDIKNNSKKKDSNNKLSNIKSSLKEILTILDKNDKE